MKHLSRYILEGVVILLLLSSVFHPAHAKTFKGRVVDADTKGPIEGAVVVAYWYKATATITGDATELKDVKECLTGKNGEWSINGPKGRPNNPNPLFTLMTGTYYTREPQFIVFKPGYCSWPKGFEIDSCKDKIKPGGNEKLREEETVELPKLTNRKDRIEAQSIQEPAGEGVDEKLRELHRLLNEERRNLGMREIRY